MRFFEYSPEQLPITLRLSRRVLSLPLYPELTTMEVATVCRALKQFERDN